MTAARPDVAGDRGHDVAPLPPLDTARLLLHPAVDEDRPALWAIWRDPAVRRFLFDDVPVSRERAAGVLEESFLARSRGLGLWTVRLREAPGAIGCAGLLPVGAAAASDPGLAGAVEVLAALAPSAWGRGYATEALQALLAYAFESLELVQVAAVVDVPNRASHRLVARLGFRRSGEFQGPRYPMRTYLLPRLGAWTRAAADPPPA